MTKIIVVQIVKFLAIILFTTSVVYFCLRSVAGDPELTKRGISSPAARSSADAVETKFLRAVRAYPQWLKNLFLFRFDESYYLQTHPFNLIGEHIGRTALLASVAFLLSASLAVGGAIVHARYRNAITTTALTIGARIAISTPEFWLAMMLLFCFAIYFPIFPLFGATTLAHYVLPLLTLVISRGAVMFHVLYAEIDREWSREYVQSAHIRAIPKWRIAYQYQFRNVVFTLISISTIQFGYLFGGTVIIEQIFGISGFGTLLVQALQRRDYPVAEACVLIVASIFAMLGIMADVARVYATPRLRSIK